MNNENEAAAATTPNGENGTAPTGGNPAAAPKAPKSTANANCPRCGAPASDADNFCGNCRFRLRAVDQFGEPPTANFGSFTAAPPLISVAPPPTVKDKLAETICRVLDGDFNLPVKQTVSFLETLLRHYSDILADERATASSATVKAKIEPAATDAERDHRAQTPKNWSVVRVRA